MQNPPDFTTERYLRDLRDAARVNRAGAQPALEPELAAEAAVVADRVAGAEPSLP